MKRDIIKKAIAILCGGIITSLCIIGNTPVGFDYLNQVKISSEEEQTQVDKILEYGRSKLGSKAYNNYCQRFVRECYEYAGIKGSTSVDSAIEGFQKWCVSTSVNDIPVGAVVYFKTSIYGHAGIYTGNNKMLHGVTTVREEEISDHYWSCYLGWGYQYEIEPTGTYLTDYNVTMPQKPEISIEIGTSTQETIISWNEDYNADYYSVTIINIDTNECIFTSTNYEDNSISYTFDEGNYSIDIIARETYYDISIPSDTIEFTIEKGQLLGDLNSNNSIDLIDVILLKRYIFDAYTLTIQQISNSDINADGNVNILDYSLLKQKYITNN